MDKGGDEKKEKKEEDPIPRSDAERRYKEDRRKGVSLSLYLAKSFFLLLPLFSSARSFVSLFWTHTYTHTRACDERGREKETEGKIKKD